MALHRSAARQCCALTIKDIHLRRRMVCLNLCFIVFPLVMIGVLGVLQLVFRNIGASGGNVTVSAFPVNALPPGVTSPTNVSVFYTAFYAAASPSAKAVLGTLTSNLSVPGTGYLGRITRYGVQLSAGATPVGCPSFRFFDDQNALDVTLNDQVRLLNSVARSDVTDNSTLRYMLPDGAVYVEAADATTGRFNVTVQVDLAGSNVRLDATSLAARTVGFIDRAFLAVLNTTVGASIQPMPFAFNATRLDIVELGGIGLIPFALAFLLPSFLGNIVVDKEQHLDFALRIAGLRRAVYWFETSVFSFVFYCIPAFLFVILEVALGARFFSQSAPSLVAALFLLWGYAQVAMAAFFSLFFSRTRSALIFGYLLVIIAISVSQSLNNTVYRGDVEPAFILWLLPYFSFYRVITLMFNACTSLTPTVQAPGCLQWSDVTPLSQVGVGLWSLAAVSTVMVLVVLIVELARAGSCACRCACRRERRSAGSAGKTDAEAGAAASGSAELTSAADEADAALSAVADDEDVRKERTAALDVGGSATEDVPLLLTDVRHQYAPNFPPALRGVSMALRRGTVFGLLGPNGAGKTTLVSILSGAFTPSGGAISLLQSDKRPRAQLGMCPQFDTLWPDLTVAEHMYLFARMQGVPSSEMDAQIKSILEALDLYVHRDKLTTQLSGGMRRRLSTAVALIGDPEVLLLDEPSAGLDLLARQDMWSALRRTTMSDRVTIITTHDMDEATELCNRIGIIALGKLRCIGTLDALQGKYGEVFNVRLVCGKPADAVFETLQAVLPGSKSMSRFGRNLDVTVPVTRFSADQVFDAVARMQASGDVLQFSVAQASLEDIFHQVVVMSAA